MGGNDCRCAFDDERFKYFEAGPDLHDDLNPNWRFEGGSASMCLRLNRQEP